MLLEEGTDAYGTTDMPIPWLERTISKSISHLEVLTLLFNKGS
jgi:hypothetical protein